MGSDVPGGARVEGISHLGVSVEGRSPPGSDHRGPREGESSQVAVLSQPCTTQPTQLERLGPMYEGLPIRKQLFRGYQALAA